MTTLGIGGPARYFVEASSEGDVLEAVGFAASAGLPLMVLGAGSNLLVSDAGFPGLVLRVRVGGVRFEQDGADVVCTAGAGFDWDPLVSECVSRGLAGVECLSGIPGWVGGTPVQNVGAYGQEVSGVIAAVRAWDHQAAKIVELPASACGFSYRRSVFNGEARGRYIILEVTYRLRKGASGAIRYPDLERFFAGRASPPGIDEVREAVLRIRASKAMLLVEGDPDARSAGSFFRNPVVAIDVAARVDAVTGEDVPRYPAPDGRVKLPAAWLIERAGFRKGTRRGNVGLSTKHTLALVNHGGASAGEVITLAGAIQAEVERLFGVRLQAEPVFVGFSDETVGEFGAVAVGNSPEVTE